MKLKATEKQVQNAISDYLSVNSIIHRRTNSGALKIAKRFVKFAFWMYPQSNEITEYKILDLDGILPDGKAFFCECKATGKTPDEGQWNTINFINRETKAVALWADSIDMFIEKWNNINNKKQFAF